jgi:hypothetical protein
MRRLIIFLLIASLAAASPLDAGRATQTVTVGNDITIEPKTPNYVVESMEARVSWLPQDSYRQDVKSLTTTPSATRDGEHLVFTWTSPKQDTLTFQLNSTVTTSNAYYPVTDPGTFPTNTLPPELSTYLEPQPIIDITPAIQRTAIDVARNASTTYDAAVRVAAWINEEINYSLSTLTREASQPSSWVLKNKKGVCDEITSLYISMLRSIGIPARFTYGMAYTNIDDAYGGHGWAEVYIDGNWVPMDPTYGQYGYVDAGHVTMGHSLDANRPAVLYTSKARNAQLSTTPLRLDTALVQDEPKTPTVDVQATPRHATTSLNSDNIIDTTVRNTASHYTPISLTLTLPDELDGERSKTLILKPGEERRVAWHVTVDDLDDAYRYTFPVTVRTGRGANATTTFQGTADGPTYDVTTKQSSQESHTLSCAAPPRIYTGSTVTITCTTNHDQICHDECTSTNGTTTYTKTIRNAGVTTYSFTAGDTTDLVTIDAITEPHVDIVTADTRSTGDTTNVKFNVTSQGTPVNTTVTFAFQGETQTWNLTTLNHQPFDVTIPTSTLTFQNEYEIRVTYHDKLGKTYQALNDERFTYEPATHWATIRTYMNELALWLQTF